MNQEYGARVARIAALHCVGVRELSLPHIARLVKESGADTDIKIFEAVARLVKKEPQHFDLRGPRPTGTRADATARLNLGNAMAAQKEAKVAPPKVSPEEKERIRKWGAGYGLAVSNREAAARTEAPAFVTEANDDE